MAQRYSNNGTDGTLISSQEFSNFAGNLLTFCSLDLDDVKGRIQVGRDLIHGMECHGKTICYVVLNTSRVPSITRVKMSLVFHNLSQLLSCKVKSVNDFGHGSDGFQDVVIGVVTLLGFENDEHPSLLV